MHIAKRVSCLFLVGIMIMSYFVMSASAANTTDSDFSTTVYSTYWSGIPARAKEDASPIFLYIDTISNGGTHVQVAANGNKTGTGGFTNYTYANGVPVNSVICRKLIQYSVHNTINENECTYALLSFRLFHELATCTVSGTWSPDSTGTYMDPV